MCVCVYFVSFSHFSCNFCCFFSSSSVYVARFQFSAYLRFLTLRIIFVLFNKRKMNTVLCKPHKLFSIFQTTNKMNLLICTMQTMNKNLYRLTYIYDMNFIRFGSSQSQNFIWWFDNSKHCHTLMSFFIEKLLYLYGAASVCMKSVDSWTNSFLQILPNYFILFKDKL